MLLAPALLLAAEFLQYSPAKQVTPANAAQLQVAWKYATGHESKGSEMQCRPLFLDGVVYATTPRMHVIALAADTGKLVWSFDPHNGKVPTSKFRNRGMTMWSNGKQARLFVAAANRLYALDAKTGRPVTGFGKEGWIDLREGLGRDPQDLTVGANSPGVVYKDLLIMGSIVPESLPAAPGDIRAYDVHTGALKWSFHTIPHPGEFGYDTWPKDGWKHLGGANSWAGLALDEKRGIVFAPTGSASYDFYGANRPGDNLFANSLVALDAATGKRLWHFQFVKHDVWDRDLPSMPALVTVRRDGKKIDAVAQITKQGYVYVFDRESGKSLFPLREIDVPPSPVDGEVLAKKQVLPVKPEPYSRQEFTEDIVTNRTPEARRAVLERLRKLKNGPQFTPPSLEGTVVFPGFDGGGEWGGPAFDPETGLLYVNANEMAWVLRLVPKEITRGPSSGRTIYNRNCAACHHEDLAGSPPEFPALRDIAKKHSEAEVRDVIVKGAGRMPGFRRLPEHELNALLRFLMRGENVTTASETSAPGPNDLKYSTDGYNKFLDPDGFPAVAPPWGTLNAINLNTGEYAWKIPFGEIPESGLKNTGSENYGGGIVTAGGVLFIGATNHDKKMRVYDKRTGKLLWEYTMDAAGNATPVVYEWKGRQYVVIAAGGGKSGAPSGGSYYAFALPSAVQ